jgi:hypothetical protein
MVDLLSSDVILGFIVVAVAAIAIIMFLRASGGKKQEEPIKEEKKIEDPLRVELQVVEKRVKVPPLEKKIALNDIEQAKSQIRTLTLKQEINSIVLRRLFEAEDEGEVSREERGRLGKPYEDEMKQISEDLKRSEMLVSLAELESIREEIVQKFEESLSQTQVRIDTIMKELKLEQVQKPIEEEKQKLPLSAKKRRITTRTKTAEESDEEEESVEAETSEKRPPRGDVESRLEQLKKEVMKELDELDKLELEA